MPEFPAGVAWANGARTRAQLIGTPTLVHFWSAGCPMSEAALPLVNEWRRTYGGDSSGERAALQVVGVHLPREASDAEAARERIAAHGVTHPVLLDDKREAAAAFGCACAPAYYAFDREGRLRHYQAGEQGLGLLARRIHKLVVP
ncbi:MAG TPA: redoxin family protein [Paenibacillus sp.]|nr:redoxin family protein [Paenibacillus sp.]